MYSVTGSVNGNSIIVDENLHAFEGHKVIVTILDNPVAKLNHTTKNDIVSKRKAAAREIAGMWKSNDTGSDVDEIVRNMRKGRSFDI